MGKSRKKKQQKRAAERQAEAERGDSGKHDVQTEEEGKPTCSTTEHTPEVLGEGQDDSKIAGSQRADSAATKIEGGATGVTPKAEALRMESPKLEETSTGSAGNFGSEGEVEVVNVPLSQRKDTDQEERARTPSRQGAGRGEAQPGTGRGRGRGKGRGRPKETSRPQETSRSKAVPGKFDDKPGVSVPSPKTNDEVSIVAGQFEDLGISTCKPPGKSKSVQSSPSEDAFPRKESDEAGVPKAVPSDAPRPPQDSAYVGTGARPKTRTEKSPSVSSQYQPGPSDKVSHQGQPRSQSSKVPVPPQVPPAALAPPMATDQLGFPIPSQPAGVQLPSNVGSMEVTLRPPKRPGFGTLGRPIRLRANHFDIRMKLEGTVLQYHVEVKPEKRQLKTSLPKWLSRQIIKELEEQHPSIFAREKPFYDGKSNLYSGVPLRLSSQERNEFKVVHTTDEDNEIFLVYIKEPAVNQIDLSKLGSFLQNLQGEVPVEAVNVLDILLRHLPSLSYTSRGQSLYLPPEDYQFRDSHLGGGRELWFGYHQSVRISGWKTLALNFDITASAFYKEQSVVDLVDELIDLRRVGQRPLANWQLDKVYKELKGLKVQTEYNGKKKRKIVGLSPRPAKMQSFPITDNAGRKKEITVAQYFKMRYKIDLSSPMLPCVQFGKEDGHNYVPMELCFVLKQKVDKALSDRQQANMIKTMAKPAPERERLINQLMEHAMLENNELLDQFGININSQMRVIDGRVLVPPPILYQGEGNRAQPREGAWDGRGKRYYKGVSLPKWGLICLANDQRQGLHQNKLESFIEQLQKSARQGGMQMGAPKFVERRDAQNMSDIFDKCSRDESPGFWLIVVILSEEKGDYEKVKQIGDVKKGIRTQCVKSRSVDRHNPVLVSNICHKINAKLGGINNVLDKTRDAVVRPVIFDRPCMIFGADVTHPAARNTTHPSVASVVGSLDANFVKYSARSRVQKHRQEIIGDLTNVIVDLLKDFYACTKVKPEKLIFYRDGVGEGQFNQVLNVELRAIRQACLNLQKDGSYKPGITFIVVQKRHHTRLFCNNEKDCEGRAKNVPAGTCVDKDITHPRDFDYFLCSHTGIQGTSKPTHYNILWDDNKLTADQLQLLTYQLCHAYVNCTRSVSIPAPVYYAHKGAFRARAHLEEILNGRESKGCDENGFPLREMQEAIECHEGLKHSMYFI